MARRAIIRLGDPTTHGGTVSEAFAALTVYGRNASGIGHRGYCPKCRREFVIMSGARNYKYFGQEVALEGMVTSCGASLIATQNQATVEDNAAEAFPEQVANDHRVALDERAVTIEHWYTLEDEQGRPIEGYRYDLLQAGEKIVCNHSFDRGFTSSIPGHESTFAVWLDYDSAKN